MRKNKKDFCKSDPTCRSTVWLDAIPCTRRPRLEYQTPRSPPVSECMTPMFSTTHHTTGTRAWEVLRTQTRYPEPSCTSRRWRAIVLCKYKNSEFAGRRKSS
eukprot:08082_4